MNNLTVSMLFAAIQGGDLAIEARETELMLDPLSDPNGPDCYPHTFLDFQINGEKVAEVGVWKMGQYMKGPNRQDTGEYIGPGWQFIVVDEDGQTTGRPIVKLDENGIVSVKVGEGMSGEFAFNLSDDDENRKSAEFLEKALMNAYETITVQASSDEDVLELLLDSEPGQINLSVEIGDFSEDIELKLYAANDAGRPVFTYEGAEQIWTDAEECVQSARKFVRESLEVAARNLEDDDMKLVEKLQSQIEV